VEATTQQARPIQSRFGYRPGRKTLTALAIVGLLTLFFVLFDWNWLRPSLEHYLKQRTGRTVTADDLQVSFGARFAPTIRLGNVYVENTSWAGPRPMAVARVASFTFSLSSLLEQRPVVSHVLLVDADVDLERQPDGLTNWRLAHPDDRSAGKVKILALETRNSRLRYSDRLLDLQLQAAASEPSAAERAQPRVQGKGLTIRVDFDGAYKGVKFAGNALSGSVLTFFDSGTFPVLGHATADHTRVDVDGTMSDAVKLNVADARLRIAGGTLSELYPFLTLPLPSTHPYQVEGELRRTVDGGYEYLHFRGKIGNSDIGGSGSYAFKSPRPLLIADLHSSAADLADLGPLIGIQDSASATTESASPHAKPQRHAPGRHANDNGDAPPAASAHVLPQRAFDVERLGVIDAQVTFVADKMKSTNVKALDSLRFTANLDEGILRLNPLDFGIAGGHMVGNVTLDAHQQPVAWRSTVAVRKVQLARLFPDVPAMTRSEGVIGAEIDLRGRGDSVGAALGNASGSMMATMEGGRISNLLDAELGLNVGKILVLMIGGDRNIDIHCGALAFQFENGLGRSQVIVLDTEQTRTEGTGTMDLRDEQFDFLLKPRPKRPSILSLRAPIRLHGSFEHPDYSVDKGKLLARAGGATVLGAINPLAFFLPLIEPGKPSDGQCAGVLGAATMAGEANRAPAAVAHATDGRTDRPL
jgi:AsmA family protein